MEQDFNTIVTMGIIPTHRVIRHMLINMLIVMEMLIVKWETPTSQVVNYYATFRYVYSFINLTIQLPLLSPKFFTSF